MTHCDVCCEKINQLHHKKVACSFCDLVSCRTCTQKYLLSIHEDPHCMGCKHEWNREFVDSFCTKKFRHTDLRRHRETILFERERARMPETQPRVERILKIRKLRHIALLQRHELIRLLQTHVATNLFHPAIEDLHTQMEHTYREIEMVRNGEYEPIDPGVFRRKCPLETCKGFLNDQWFCGLCDTYYCKNCNDRWSDGHACNPDTVKTMTLISKDTKPCPKCGTMIHKIDGCAQMWCTDCHTAFHWMTGTIETGRVHNPHFIAFRRNHTMAREHGDIPCGGLPSVEELWTVGAPLPMCTMARAIHDVDRENIYNDLGPPDTMDIRISYMLNDIDEPSFKKLLQHREKMFDRSRDMTAIFELVINVGGDLLRQYVLEPHRYEEFYEMLVELTRYANTVFKSIRERYKTAIPESIDIFV